MSIGYDWPHPKMRTETIPAQDIPVQHAENSSWSAIRRCVDVLSYVTLGTLQKIATPLKNDGDRQLG